MSEKRAIKVKDEVTARKRLIEQEVQNKIYYDVGIKYNPDEVDGMYGFYSKAETEIHLSTAIVDDPLNYDLAISKFKIDTECLPIMIPEMKLPATYDENTQEMATTYKIWIHFPKPDDTVIPPAAQNFRDGSAAHKCYYTKGAANDCKHPNTQAVAGNELLYHKIYQSSNSEAITIIPNCGCPPKSDTSSPPVKRYNTNFKTRITMKDNAKIEYALNTDPSYYIYDYQSFLDRINYAIEKKVTEIFHANFFDKDNKTCLFDISPLMCIHPIFFKAEDGKVNMYINKHFLDSQFMIRFSGNLYKYIGMGFKTKFFYSKINDPAGGYGESGSFFIDYNSFPFTGNDYQTEEGYTGYKIYVNDHNNVTMPHYKRSTFPFTCDITETVDKVGTFTNQADFGNDIIVEFKENNNNENIKYVIYKQQFSSLPNWNVCKGIIVTSSFMPIKSEYYPTATNDGFLTHYDTEDYREAQQYLGFVGGEKSEEQAIFNKQSMKVIEVYYPMSSSAGDIRSCIIYDNTNIENGNKIDMQGGVDLDHFDIKIKWIDIYGNTYPLYLAPGCNVNIRFCLTRKKLRRDDLIEGFNTITELLGKIANATTSSEDDKNHLFDVTLEPKRKRNKVDLPNTLENGLIVKS